MYKIKEVQPVSTKENKPRMSLYLPQDLKDYVNKQAEAFGISTNAFIIMIMQNYRMQVNSLTAMANAQDMLDRVEELKKDINV